MTSRSVFQNTTKRFRAVVVAVVEVVRALFRNSVGAGEAVFLPVEEMAEALTSDYYEDLFIGVAVDVDDQTVVLYRATGALLLVPVSWFKGGPKSPKPDLSRPAVIDGGQTICLGDFEAAADAILYEFDANYRKRARKNRIEKGKKG